MVSERIDLINNLIFKNVYAEHNDGLLHGKMGIAIYLYHLGRALKYEKCTILANELIDLVYEGVGQNSVKTDFKNGLAGIAWGIEHLVHKGFLNADTDEILRDLDDKIFQYLSRNSVKSIELSSGHLGYGFYLLSRLEGKYLVQSHDHVFLLKRLLITIINNMYEVLEENEEVFQEPVGFDSTWNLPYMLLFLSEARAMNLYNHKIDIIFQRIVNVVCGIFPVNEANRLSLLISIEKVIKLIELKSFRKYHKLLLDSLKIPDILAKFPDKNICVQNGLAGLLLIFKLFQFNVEHHKLQGLSTNISSEITSSKFWKEIEEKEKMHSGQFGLLSGLAGIGMALVSQNI